MPRIPTYDRLTVRPTEAPNIEGALSGTKVSPNAMDSLYNQNEREAHGLTQLGRTLAAVAVHQQHQTNLDKVMGAEAQIKDQYSQFHAQLAQRQGTNAFGATADATKWWDDNTQKIADTLQNPAQQEAFKQRAEQLKSQSIASVSMFEAHQRHKSLVDSADAALKTSVNFAASNATDPGIVGQTADDMKAHIIQVGQTLGWTPAVLKQHEQQAMTEMHKAVIDQLAVDHPLAAQDYYKLHKNEIAGTVRTDIERTLHAGDVKEVAQNAGDYVVGKGMGESDALAWARKKYSGDYEDAAVRAIRERFSEREQIKAQSEHDAADRAFQIYAKTGSVSHVPPATLAAMNGKTRVALQKLAAHDAAGTPVKTNWDTYYELKQKALNNPQGFRRTDLRQYFPDLAPTQREQLIRLQTAAPKQHKQAATLQQQLTMTHDELGWTPSNNRKTIGKFDSAVTEQIDAEQERQGRALNYKERQEIIDRLAVQGKIAGSGTWRDTHERFYQAEGTPDAAHFQPTVPKKDTAQITEALQRHGMAATTANIQWLYEVRLGLPHDAKGPDSNKGATNSDTSSSPFQGMPGSPTAK